MNKTKVSDLRLILSFRSKLVQQFLFLKARSCPRCTPRGESVPAYLWGWSRAVTSFPTQQMAKAPHGQGQRSHLSA